MPRVGLGLLLSSYPRLIAIASSSLLHPRLYGGLKYSGDLRLRRLRAIESPPPFQPFLPHRLTTLLPHHASSLRMPGLWEQKQMLHLTGMHPWSPQGGGVSKPRFHTRRRLCGAYLWQHHPPRFWISETRNRHPAWWPHTLPGFRTLLFSTFFDVSGFSIKQLTEAFQHPSVPHSNGNALEGVM